MILYLCSVWYSLIFSVTFRFEIKVKYGHSNSFKEYILDVHPPKSVFPMVHLLHFHRIKFLSFSAITFSHQPTWTSLFLKFNFSIIFNTRKFILYHALIFIFFCSLSDVHPQSYHTDAIRFKFPDGRTSYTFSFQLPNRHVSPRRFNRHQ